ncbi:MAG: hypothetical protein P8179_21070 [Candidatus Thiodiazotropha sp.]
MKQSILHLCILLSLTLVAACANSEEPGKITKFLVAPQKLSPEKISVDFDGDGATDQILVTGLKGSTAELLKNIVLIHPWEFDEKRTNTANLAAGSKNSFYIILSSTKCAYIVNDANPISILDTDAARDLFAVKKNEILEMGLDEISGKIRGDLIGIPTEAGIDTYLYWNGNTFISYEPLEMP